MQHSRVRLKIADRNSEQYLYNNFRADEVSDHCLGNGYCRCESAEAKMFLWEKSVGPLMAESCLKFVFFGSDCI